MNIWFLEANSSVSVLVPQLWSFDVEKNLIFFLSFVIDVLILISILEYSPLANVAHNISPVPVLNCELLNGPEPRREGALSFPGSFLGLPVWSFDWKKKNESKALNWSLKPLETLQISAAQDGMSRTLRLSGDDVPRSRAVFFMVSVAASLENVCELNKKKTEKTSPLSPGLHFRGRTLHFVALGRARW